MRTTHRTTVTDVVYDCRDCAPEDVEEWESGRRGLERLQSKARRHTITTGHQTGVSVTRLTTYRQGTP